MAAGMRRMAHSWVLCRSASCFSGSSTAGGLAVSLLMQQGAFRHAITSAKTQAKKTPTCSSSTTGPNKGAPAGPKKILSIKTTVTGTKPARIGKAKAPNLTSPAEAVPEPLGSTAKKSPVCAKTTDTKAKSSQTNKANGPTSTPVPDSLKGTAKNSSAAAKTKKAKSLPAKPNLARAAKPKASNKVSGSEAAWPVCGHDRHTNTTTTHAAKETAKATSVANTAMVARFTPPETTVEAAGSPRPTPVKQAQPNATDGPKKTDRSGPDYKQAAGKWTRFLVGMPILLVTSYLLFQRLAKQVSCVQDQPPSTSDLENDEKLESRT